MEEKTLVLFPDGRRRLGDACLYNGWFPRTAISKCSSISPPTDEIKTGSMANEKGTVFAGEWENISALIGPEKWVNDLRLD